MTMTHDDDDDGIILPALADDLELVAALCKMMQVMRNMVVPKALNNWRHATVPELTPEWKAFNEAVL